MDNSIISCYTVLEDVPGMMQCKYEKRKNKSTLRQKKTKQTLCLDGEMIYDTSQLVY